ncbi:uncharacterized protein A1O5_13126 [Cladophialophora psammophila CBS 110553]|uniref:Uncharacterized protein n=1 Tax=Cladophialophora psammophila CBS 110553 TaxID=1182543 RepID=W9W526_9EURO|nr:uncharacterized protein A1O5_13126 [Cladophialophora psammophila CBS 110553]EXJ53674.1 hypothetical protein A1O5_13126 [Cladophialophora psammophila CBS 110553]
MGCDSIILCVEVKSAVDSKHLQRWGQNLQQAIPTCTSVFRLHASDKHDSSKPYRDQYLINLENPEALTQATIEHLRSESSTLFSSSDWNIYHEIARRSRPGLDGNEYPPTGTEYVQVGMDPTLASTQDYLDWFDQEHQGMLAEVPGWRGTRRYRLVSSHGSGREHAALFLSASEYDVENGLGGPIWQRSIDTPWTGRVRENLARPYHRRTWKFVPL